MNMVSCAILVATCGFQGEPMVEPASGPTTRGITGEVVIEVEGPAIRPRADLDLDSPMLVRVIDTRELVDGRVEYRLGFLGVNIGTYDLRDVLETADGSQPEHLAPIPVEIVTNLAGNAGTDVYVNHEPGLPLAGGYRLMLWIIGLAWFLVPIVAFIQHSRRQEPAPSVEEDSGLTFAEQLRPLVVAASHRGLSVAERGRLELLLYAHWQEHLQLAGIDRPEAVMRLRDDDQAGTLLRAVESWLHQPGSASAGATPEEIDQLLAPYRRTAPVEVESAS